MYHLLLGQTPQSPQSVLPQKTSPMEEQPHMLLPLPQHLKNLPGPKDKHPLPDPMERMLMGRTAPKATLGGPPALRGKRPSPWFETLHPSHAEAFSQDSSIVKEARLEFFSRHSCNFTIDGAHDVSRTFKQLAVNANLLGTSIYKIQSSWTGPKELKQANYSLLSLPKGFEISLGSTPFRISQGHGADGYS